MTTLAVDPGLAAFSVQDLCHPAGLRETILAKLHLLPAGRLAHERLEREVRLMLDVVCDAVCGEFRRLPLTALADFLNALHYFLVWRDRRPDTWEGGYMDDLEVALRVVAGHQEVLADYRSWRAARQHGCQPPLRSHLQPAGARNLEAA